MRTAAVIVAAGSGERLGAGVPKALVRVAGLPMVAWSARALAESPDVECIVIACPPGGEDDIIPCSMRIFHKFQNISSRLYLLLKSILH